MKVTELEVSFVKDEPDSVVSVPQIDLDGGGIVRPFDPDLPTGTVCGLGPQVVVAGRTLQTRVDGTLGDLLSGAPMRLSTCSRRDPDGPVPSTRLEPGRTSISTRRTSEFDVVAVAGGPTTGSRDLPRAVRVESDSGTGLVAEVAAGAEAVVSAPWNYNAGWEAELDGRPVRAIRVDGWQQGWIVPAGEGGTLAVEFGPQRSYTLVLLAGLVVSGALLLGALALLLLGRLRRASATPVWRAWPAVGAAPVAARAVVLAIVVALIGWVAGAGFLVASLWLRRDLQRLVIVTVVLVLGSGALDAWPLPVPGSVADALAVGGFGVALALALRGHVPVEDVR